MKRTFALVTLFVLTILAPSAASAEWFIEPYAGAAFTRDTDVDVNATSGGFTIDGEFKDVDLEDSLMAGIRTGFWFESLPYIGLAVEAFYFRPDVKAQTVTFTGTGSVTVGNEILVSPGSSQAILGNIDLYAVGFAADVMLRLLLGGGEGETALFQPYLLAGPAWILTVSDNTVEPSLGLKAGGGLALMFSKNFGIFVEYNFTRFKPKADVKSGNVTAELEATITSHAIVGGISLRF